MLNSGILSQPTASQVVQPPVPATLLAHWDAGDESSISSVFGAVAAIEDLSGGELHLLAGEGQDGALPTTSSRAVNGLNVLDFQYSSLFRLDTPVSSPLIVFMVLGKDETPAHVASLISASGVGSANVVCDGLSLSGVGSGSVSLSGYGVANVLAISIDPANTRSFIECNTSRNTATAQDLDLLEDLLLCGNAGSGWLDGFLAECKIFTGQMDDGEITAEVTTLAQKWNVQL